MDDIFREIPTDKISLALDWAYTKTKCSRNRLWFGIAKGKQRHLDRIGPASSTDFRCISCNQVLFTFKISNFFTIGQLIVELGLKDLIIGGFPSAQLADIWATWREFLFLLGQKATTQGRVNQSMTQWGIDYKLLNGPFQTGS